MKDIIPESTPKSAKVERYTNEIDAQKKPKIIAWLLNQNAFFWGCGLGAFVAIYRNFDRILAWF